MDSRIKAIITIVLPTEIVSIGHSFMMSWVLNSWKVYWFLKAAITKYQSLGGFKQQKFIPSQFWRLGVWNQGIGSAMFSLKVHEENLSHAFVLASGVAANYCHSLVCWHISNLCLCHHMALSLCFCLFFFSPCQSYLIKGLPHSSMTSA